MTHIIHRSLLYRAAAARLSAMPLLLAMVTAGASRAESESADVPEGGSNALAAVFSYTRPATYKINVAQDILVPMRDGFVLTCDLYRPAMEDATPAPGQFPGIVLNFTGYGRTVFSSGNDIREFTAMGYNT